MLGVLITLTRGRRNKLIDCHKAKVRIAVLPIIDVKTQWNSTVKLLGQGHGLREFTRQRLTHPKYSDYWPLFTTQDEWTIIEYMMEVSTPFQYRTLWMSKEHTVTLHNVITVYNDMFDHMDGVMRASARKMIYWKKDIYLAIKVARQQASEY